MHAAYARPLRLGLGALLLLQLASFGLRPADAHADTATARLIIGEIDWAGSASNPSDQWVEFYNPTTQPLDLSADPYTLTVAGQTVATLDSRTVAPMGTLVVSRLGTSGALSSQLPVQTDPSLVLPVIDAQYVLSDAAGNTDTANPAMGAPFAGASGAGAASEARVINADGTYGSGDQADSWTTSQTVGQYLNAGSAEYGTPGEGQNLQVPQPTNIAINAAQYDRPTVTATFPSNATYGVVQFVNTATGAITVGVGDSVSGFQPATPLTPGNYAISVAAAVSPQGDRSAFMAVPVSGSTDGTYTVGSTAPSAPTAAPTVDATYPAQTNAASVTLTGTVPAGTASVTATANGTVITEPIAAGATTFSIAVPLQANTTNTIQVQSIAADGTQSQAAVVSILQSTAPAQTPASDHIAVASNPGGTADTVQGTAGSVQPGAMVSVYADSALTRLIGTATANQDGSFGPIAIGDNMYSTVYVVQTDAYGNMSPAVSVANQITIAGETLNLPIQFANVSATGVTVQLLPMTGVVSYMVKYHAAGMQYGAPVTVCGVASASCSLSTDITGLQPDQSYSVAVAAVDANGNVSNYTESSFQTLAAPATAATGAQYQPLPPMATATPAPAATPAPSNSAGTAAPKAVATPAPTVAPTPTATPLSSASPTETGSVKSASTKAAHNWTPWIVLGVLIGLAILATAGYFYWFGGEAGAAYDAAARPTPPAPKNDASANDADRNRSNRRW